MGASQVICVTLGAGGFEVAETRPVVLTSVIIAELSGTKVAKVILVDWQGEMTYAQFYVPAGSSVVWADRVALPAGLGVYGLSGSMAVTVAYE